MAKKKDVAQRFYDFVSEDIALQGLAEQNGPLQGAVITRPKIDWRNKAFRAAAAETALHIASFYGDDCLKKAFDAAQLDPDDPESWATLLRIFSLAHFGPSTTKRGGKLVWDWRKWSQLLADFAAVKASHPNYKDSSVCKNILIRFSSRYPKIKSGTIRRNLQYARDVKKNEYLKMESEAFEKSIEEAAAKRGRKMSRTEIESKAIEKAIQKIAKEFERAPERP
jgi:hypothetical protein